MVVGDDAPVDIVANISSDPARNCTSSCTFSFVYSPSACNVIKRTNNIQLPYDQSTTYPVIYNQTGYKAVRIEIYQPSLHKYDGDTAKAELLAYHVSQNGDNLIVSIPLDVGSSGKQSSNIMNEILQNLPTSLETPKSIGSITNFNLGDLIPKVGFFTYTGKHLISKTGTYTYVVYHKKDAITVSRDSIKSLTDTTNRASTAIQPIQAAMSTTKTFYSYNKSGANNSGSDDYYLQCDNAGYDGTILYQGATPGDGEKFDKTKGIDWKGIMASNSFKTFIGVLFGVFVAIIIFAVGFGFLNWWGKRKEAAAAADAAAGAGGGSGS
jgi:carbonic anhydrase